MATPARSAKQGAPGSLNRGSPNTMTGTRNDATAAPNTARAVASVRRSVQPRARVSTAPANEAAMMAR